MPGTRLTALKIGEIAVCPRGANQHADIVLAKADVDDGDYPSGVHKRKFTADERRHAADTGAAMPGGRYPIENGEDLHNALRAIGRGKGSHAAIRRHIEARARTLGLTSQLPDTWHTEKSVIKMPDGALHELNDDICTALEALDDAIAETASAGANVDKHRLIADCFNDFENHIGTLETANVVKALVNSKLAEHGFERANGAVVKTVEGGHKPMKEIAKSLGLPETATETEILAAIGKSLALAKMSGKHRAFMENDKAKMPKGGKEAFQTMSAEERDAHIKSNPVADDEPDDDDEMEKSGKLLKLNDGTRVLKSVVGDAAFQFMKQQVADAKVNKEKIAKLEDERALAAVVKRLTPLTFVGKAEELAPLIHAVEKTAPDTAKAIEAQFAKLNGMLEKSKLFEEMGNGTGGNDAGGDAYQKLMAKAEELRKTNTKLTSEQAFAKVYEDKANAELVKQYRTEKRN